MKKILFVAAALLVLVGCKSKQNEPVQLVPVNFTVSIPGLKIEAAPANSPAKAPAENNTPDHLYVFEGKKLHKDLTSFDEITIELEPGEHKLNFVATKDAATFNEETGVLTPAKAEHTYGKVLTVNVSEDAENENIVDLTRVYYLIDVQSEDVVPSDGKYTVRFRISKKYAGLTDGLAGTTETTDVILGTVNATSGKTFSQTIAGFNPVFNEEATNILETIVYKDGVKINKFVTHNVPLLSNRKTILKGKLFEPDKIQVNIVDTWNDDANISILDSEN